MRCAKHHFSLLCTSDSIRCVEISGLSAESSSAVLAAPPARMCHGHGRRARLSRRSGAASGRERGCIAPVRCEHHGHAAVKLYACPHLASFSLPGPHHGDILSLNLELAVIRSEELPKLSLSNNSVATLQDINMRQMAFWRDISANLAQHLENRKFLSTCRPITIVA